MRKRFLAGMLSLLAAFPIEVYSQDRLDGTAAVTPTGGASYTVQVQVPKGYGDLKPSIALTYNSQSGNGIAGWGCSITGISAITRGMKNYLYGETPKGIKYSTSDALYLDGKRLIKVSGTEGSDGSVYSPEGEPLTKVTLHGSSISTSSWLEVDTNDGMTYEFGHATGTQQTTRVASAQRPFAWYISKCTNNLGQTITYQYQTSDRYLYPQTISYGGGNTVDFEYEARTDTITFTLNGLKGYVGKRLKSVSTKAGGNVYRIYKMTYDTTSDACTTKYSRLTYITETGTTGNSSSRQIKVDWNNLPSFSPSCATLGITPPQDDNLHEYGERYLMAGDLNGDGVSDIVHLSPVTITNSSSVHKTKSTHNYLMIYNSQINNGSVSYKAPLSIIFDGTISLGAKRDKKGFPVCIDLDGDGKNDIILPGYRTGHDNNHIFYFIYAFGKDISNLKSISYSKDFDLGIYGYPLFCYNDFDNDGQSDIFLLNTFKSHNNYYNCNLLSIENNSIVTKKSFKLKIESNPRKVFASDYNGDGLSDIMVICDDGYRIYNNLGDNTFSDNTTLNDGIKSSYHLEQGDFNGDGILDFVWNDNYSNKLYFSLGNGNGTFTKKLAYTLPVKILPKNTDTGTWNCLVTDLDRDGKSDVVINFAAYTVTSGFLKTNTLWLVSNGSSLTLKKSASSKKESDAKAGHICVGDFKGKGWLDVLNYGYDCWGGNNANVNPTMHLYSCRSHQVSDGKVKSVKNSDGRITSFTYGSLTSDKLYTKGSGSVYPLIDVAAPLCVVSQMRESGASPVIRRTDYTYKELRAHLKGRGILGFTEQTSSEYYTGKSTTAKITGWNTQHCVPVSTSTTTTQGGFTTTSASSATVVNYGSNYMVYPSTLTEKDIYGNVTTTTFSYNTSKGYLTKKRTEFGGSNMYRQTEYTYSANKIGKAYRPETVKQTQKHSDSGQAYSTTTKYTYAANGLPAKVVEHSGTPMALTKEYVYDTYGNTTKETVSGASMSTMVTNFQYSGGKFLLQRSTTPASSTVYYGLNPFGEVMARIDMTYAGPSSQPLITNYTYNGFGMVTKETKPSGAVTTYNRTTNSNGSGYTITVTKAGGGTVTTKYDALDNELSRETKGVGGTVIKTTNTYNSKGLLTTSTNQKGNLTITESMGYDALGRMVSHTSSSGTNATYTYGNRTTTTTDHGREYIKTYDAWGNVTESTDPVSSVSYTYHSNGKPSSASSEGATVYMDYDAAGNQIRLEDPDAGICTYEYDALGRVIRQTDARGNETAYTYDAVGKLTARNCGGVVTSYTYGTSGYDKERLVKEQTGDRIINYTYNNKGLLSSETRSMTGETPVTFTYQYDDKGRLSSKTYPQGVPINYRYDAYGNLVGSDIGGRCVSLVTGDNGLSTTVVYGGTLPSGSLQVQSPLMTHTSTCDSRGYLTELRLAKTGNISLRSMLFSFDGATGNLRSRLGMTSQAEDFEYDDLDRLVGVKLNSAVSQEVDYTDNGNISSKTGLGGLYYGGPKPHAVTSIDNPQGRVSTATQQTIYTPFGKVESISENGYSMLFTYGPDEERWKTVLRQNGTVKRSTFYAGDYERITENGTTRHFYYLDNGCIYVIEGNQSTGTYYYAFTDHLGSVTRLFDESGSSVFEAEYDAWGKQTVSKNTIGFHRGYTGHEMLPEFGLINMNGRLYDPMLGRFLSPDNYVQMPDFSQSFNRYSYCINNPLKYNDPSGEFWWALAIGGIINVALNWDEIHDFGHGLASFFLGGGATLASMVGCPILGAAIAGAGNSIINQGFNNGWNSISLDNVIISTGMSMMTSVAGLKIGDVLEEPLSKLTNKISNVILRDFVQDATSGAIGGFTIGTGFSLFNGESIGDALKQGGKYALQGAAINGAGGLYRGYQDNRKYQQSLNSQQNQHNINPQQKPLQEHHYATNKNKKFTPEMEKIAQKYGLNLDNEWNKDLLPHIGRHPNAYHEWVLEQMRIIDNMLNVNQQQFINQFEIRVKQPIRNNPDMLYKKFWK